jgi:hypothetical protein
MVVGTVVGTVVVGAVVGVAATVVVVTPATVVVVDCTVGGVHAGAHAEVVVVRATPGLTAACCSSNKLAMKRWAA